MALVKANFIVAISTPTPRRLTNFRGRTANGTRGLIVGGSYYKAAIIEVPGIEESDAVAPLQIQISIGNADNLSTDLFSDTANLLAPIVIQKVEFSGTWDEAFPPTVATTAWFEGKTGKPSLRGERVVIDCYADVGRRGTSPKTKSRTLLVDHQPLSPQQKLSITTRG